MRSQSLPRAIAISFLITIVAGIIAQMFISQRLGTAAEIAANPGLFSLGFTIYLVEMAAQITMTVLFYQLLKPVHQGAALLSTVFGLVGCTIKTLARLFYIVPLVVVQGHSFSGDQVNSLVLLLLTIDDRGAALALPFFGLSTVIQGWLIVRSTYLPRWLGTLTIVGGAGWLAFLWPPLGYAAFPFIALLALVGSVAMIYWFLVRGIADAPNTRWGVPTYPSVRA
ncbi:MAG TPA: DUF4386 domain-containing protein [Gemmatimonadales bacterium]|nr:DUF4386 domain-containing protein [Gemmatimonadales bacterium]